MFTSGEIVEWVQIDGAVIREMVVKAKKDAPEGPWWILTVPGKSHLKAIVHESRIKKV